MAQNDFLTYSSYKSVKVTPREKMQMRGLAAEPATQTPELFFKLSLTMENWNASMPQLDLSPKVTHRTPSGDNQLFLSDYSTGPHGQAQQVSPTDRIMSL